MKIKKSILYILSATLLLSSCSDSVFTDINTDKNRPSSVTTLSILTSAEKQLLDVLRKDGLHLRGAQLYAQYFSQNIYTDQSRYQIPSDYSDDLWTGTYKALNNFNEIIKLNSDPATREWVTLGGAGRNATQIAVARVLKSYAFHNLADVFGDILYESYGTQDADFQALQQEPDNLTPKYASQQKVYLDILNELKQSADTLQKYSGESTFKKADIIYDGDNSKWAKLANSLRLRLANRILHKEPAIAKQHIEQALAQGVFASNADNAVFKYATTSPNEAPLYRATVIANRKDFAISHVLVEALQGKRGPFAAADPRLPAYAKKNSKGKYFGQPYGLPLAAGNLFPTDSISLPGEIINAPDYAEVLMEYAEVAFLISEYKGWEEASYQEGVRASLAKWGVAQAEADKFLSALLPATEETVLTQKYIALFNQGLEAWSEIRRTGYPKFLVKKGDVVWAGEVEGEQMSYRFEPEVGDAIPSRFIYPLKEQSTNRFNYQEAVSRQGNDVINTKVWWNK